MKNKQSALIGTGLLCLLMIIVMIAVTNLGSDGGESSSAVSSDIIDEAYFNDAADENTSEPWNDGYVEYHFRTQKQLDQHFEKHGGEFKDDFGYETAEEYEKGASDVINDPSALYKTEAEDGDGVYYIEATNEFVILSKDGYIRTYFRPSGGKKYFDKQ